MEKKQKLLRYAVLFGFGAVLYALLEIVCRGYTHWTMMLAGGICLCLIDAINRYAKASLPMRAFLGAVAITVVEFIFGCTFNLWLGWRIWDYSARRWNLLGQICPLFFLLWFLLCIPVMALLTRLDRYGKPNRHLPFSERKKRSFRKM